MVRMYKKIIERHISEIEISKLKADIEALKPLVEEIFKEDCQIYISSEDELKFTIEIHFEDCNYYEIEISAEDTREDITDNLLDYLVLERFRNLQNPHINWNNVRYCEKHKIPLQ